MSEMFGAPVGQSLAEQDQRQNTLAAVQAQKIFGEIGMQPAEKALKEAHAKLYSAEADSKAAAVEAQRQMEELNKDFQIQQMEAKDKVKELAAQGRVATVDDLAPPGVQPKNSQSAKLEKFLEFASGRGVSELQLAPFRKELSALAKDEAVTAHNFAMATLEEQKAKKANAETIAGWAAAALAHPESYQQMLMAAAQAGAPIERLPKVFDARKIEMLRLGGIEVAKQAELKLKAAEDGSQAALRNAEIKNANARTELAKARKDLELEKKDILTKYGGPTAKATLEQKEVAAGAKKAEALAREAKNWKALPLDEKQFVVDQGYTIKGQHYVYIGKGPDGKPRFESEEDLGRAKAKEITNEAPSSMDD